MTADSVQGQSPAVKGMELSMSEVAVLEMPAVDNAVLMAAEEERRGPGIAPKFAETFSVDVSPLTHGTLEVLDNGFYLWRLNVSSPGAYSLNFGFDAFHLPDGAQLHLYSMDADSYTGPFTPADNEIHNELWTPIVEGDEVIIQLLVPQAVISDVQLHLSTVNHDFVDFGNFKDGPVSESGSCNVDVVCPEGDGYRDIIRSVGVISTGGSTFCTGFLVSNTAGDGRPFFMTADHCGVGSGNASSLVVYWNYENSTCRTPGSAASGGSGNGSLSTFNTGSIFRADNSFSDFTLVELDDPINPFANAFLAGWNRDPADVGPVIAIHHPQTDEKRISFEDDPTTTTSYLGNSSPGAGSHIRVADWDLGTTEPGSSGSPIYDLNKRVVGQLHGGYAACSNNSADWYGRFSRSWDNSTGASNQLAVWLDPIGSGALSVDGMEADTTGPPPPPPVGTCPTMCTSQGNNTSDEWIESIQIGSYTNSSGDNGGYADFGEVGASFDIGATYPITLQPGWSGTLYNEYFRIWMDLDGNGSFSDPGELVYDQGTADNVTITGTLTIPSGLSPDTVRMRVQMKYNSSGTECETFTWGEVEDYCVYLTNGSGPTCDVPANPTTSILGATAATVSWDPVSGATSYLLNGRRAGTSAWRPVTISGTSRTFTIFTPSTSYEWRVSAVCGASSSGFGAIQSFTTPSSREATVVDVFAVYPNPAQEMLNVVVSASEAPIRIRIMNTVGAVVYEQQHKLAAGHNTLSLDVSSLADGMYFLEVTDEQSGKVERFSVSH